ncbi:MAG: hypothetical protein Q8O00_08325 [Holophaga sp.]|nr:hypothetical protein [Holophaga sp.]
MLSYKTPFLALLVLGASAFMDAQTPATRIADLEAAAARNGMDATVLKDLGEYYFGQAVAGDKCAVDRGLDVYISLMQLEPAKAIHPCRFGSLSTMKGRDASLPMARMWHVQKGLEALTKAVELAPDDLGIRLTRANTCNALPIQFKQIDTAIGDCQHLDGLFAKNPQQFPKDLVFQTRLLLASSLNKAGRGEEARAILEKLKIDAQGTPFAAQAKELLK